MYHLSLWKVVGSNLTRGRMLQGFAESLQQECSKPAQNELYCCGPGLLFWLLLFQIRKGLESFAKILQNPVHTEPYSQ